jgi:hypothetical protein
MGKKWIQWALILLMGSCLPACLNENDMMPTEHTISARRAKEDFTEFLQILKKAHPALYAYTPQQRLEQLADSLKATISGNITQRQLFNLLSQVVERIACSHTNLYLSDASLEAIGKQPRFFPLPLTLVEGRLAVNMAGAQLPEGAEIIRINGVAANELLANLALYNSTDGLRPQLRQHLAANDFGFQYFLRYGPQESFEVRYRVPDSTNKTLTETLRPITLDELNGRNRNDRYYYDPTDVDYDFYTVEPGGFAVMKVRTFEYDSFSKDEAFDNFCKNSFALLRLKSGIHTLIIDIRENAGGNYSNCHLLFSYLAKQSFQEYKQVSAKVKKLPESRLMSPEYSGGSPEDVSSLLNDNFDKGSNGRYYMTDSLNSMVEPQGLRFDGRVLVVVNSEVSSAASYFASLVKNTGRGKIIGEETRGGAYMHNGFRNVVYELPNSKIQFAFSIANVIHSQGSQADYGRGVQPDYPKPSTFGDFKKNRDTQLNFIQDSLINN